MHETNMINGEHIALNLWSGEGETHSTSALCSGEQITRGKNAVPSQVTKDHIGFCHPRTLKSASGLEMCFVTKIRRNCASQ